MKIVILGAGVTGSSVAGALASEENDIVVIDKREPLLNALRERFDIDTVCGNAAYPAVLEQAGVKNADIVIAVTDRDETNMLACQVIDTLYSKPKTIARVRSIDFLTHPQLFGPEGIPIDIVISPEQAVMQAIHNLIKVPGARHVSEFADGLVRLFSIKAVKEAFVTGKKIQTVKDTLANGKIRVGGIFRNGKAIPVNGESIITEGDEVFFVCPEHKVFKVLQDLHVLDKQVKSIMIAGGGHIGKRLAMALEKDYSVKVIEFDSARAKRIAGELTKTLVLKGDCTNENLLIEEMIDSTDVFCAITNNDGTNIISAALAKRLGVRKAICLLNNNAYSKLLADTGIDLGIFPNQETLGTILKHVRNADVAGVSSLCGGTAEAIEAIAHHNPNGESVVGLRVDQVKLPKEVVLGALVRNQEVIEVHHDTVFEEGDHIVMLALDKKYVKNIEDYFHRL